MNQACGGRSSRLYCKFILCFRKQDVPDLHRAEATWRMHALSGITSCAFLKNTKANHEKKHSHTDLQLSTIDSSTPHLILQA